MEGPRELGEGGRAGRMRGGALTSRRAPGRALVPPAIAPPRTRDSRSTSLDHVHELPMILYKQPRAAY